MESGRRARVFRQHTPRGGLPRPRAALMMALVVPLAPVLAPRDSVAQLEIKALSVPAPFVRQLGLPGEANAFLRPSAIFIDRGHDEVLVADPGHGRIVILDGEGRYKFEFGGDGLATPQDVAVDSQGRIYVLGTTREGRVLQLYDFDGLFLGTVDTDTPDGPLTRAASVALDSSDNLYVLDVGDFRVCSWDASGGFRHSFEIIPDLDPAQRREQVLGSLAVIDDAVYVPVSSLGTVAVHGRNGDFVRFLGHKGNRTGDLNFPVDVSARGDLVLVLDKHRFNVVCFDAEGRFLGEFGGKGLSPGWFYHPTLLETDDRDQVYVGQIFRNKIQVCRIPEFILKGLNANPLGPTVRGT